MISSNQEIQQQVILSQIPISQIFEGLRSIVREEIKAEKESELQEKFLSPEETCNLFTPKITKPTLESWSKQGLLQKHCIGKRVFYKYSEVMLSLKTLKRYKAKG